MPEYSSAAPGLTASQATALSAAEAKALTDNLAKMATVINQLSSVVGGLRDRLGKLESELAEVRPQLLALKVHTESFPNALREARRSDVAVQKAVAEFDARLRSVEARANGIALQS